MTQIVSIPLRGIEQATQGDCLEVMRGLPEFPSPCGELSRQLSLEEKLTCPIKFVSIPLRGIEQATMLLWKF